MKQKVGNRSKHKEKQQMREDITKNISVQNTYTSFASNSEVNENGTSLFEKFLQLSMLTKSDVI